MPVFTNGMGRGALPGAPPAGGRPGPRAALGEADVVVVAGTPLDFRLGFGEFGGSRAAPGQSSIWSTPRAAWRATPTWPPRRRRPAPDPRRRGGARPPPRRPGRPPAGMDRLRVAEDAGRPRTDAERGHRRRPDPPGPGLRRAARGARRRCGHHRRRRRLRLVRRDVPRRPSPGAGSTRGRTAASAPAWGTRWGPAVEPARRAGLRAARRRRGRLLADGRRLPGPAPAAGGASWSATTASGGWRSTRCGPCTATTWPPTCSRAALRQGGRRAWGARARRSNGPTTCVPALARAFELARQTCGPVCVNVALDPSIAYPRSSVLA